MKELESYYIVVTQVLSTKNSDKMISEIKKPEIQIDDIYLRYKFAVVTTIFFRICWGLFYA